MPPAKDSRKRKKTADNGAEAATAATAAEAYREQNDDIVTAIEAMRRSQQVQHNRVRLLLPRNRGYVVYR